MHSYKCSTNVKVDKKKSSVVTLSKKIQSHRYFFFLRKHFILSFSLKFYLDSDYPNFPLNVEKKVLDLGRLSTKDVKECPY